MNLIRKISNFLFPKKRRKRIRRKVRVSRWYKWPYIPKWADDFIIYPTSLGSLEHTMNDEISDQLCSRKQGTLYKVITKPGKFKIIIKGQRRIKKRRKR